MIENKNSHKSLQNPPTHPPAKKERERLWGKVPVRFRVSFGWGNHRKVSSLSFRNLHYYFVKQLLSLQWVQDMQKKRAHKKNSFTHGFLKWMRRLFSSYPWGTGCCSTLRHAGSQCCQARLSACSKVPKVDRKRWVGRCHEKDTDLFFAHRITWICWKTCCFDLFLFNGYKLLTSMWAYVSHDHPASFRIRCVQLVLEGSALIFCFARICIGSSPPLVAPNKKRSVQHQHQERSRRIP